MAALTTSRKADAPVRHGNSLAFAVDIKEKFVFKVLDDHGGHLASGRVAKLAGRRLIAQVSEHLKPDTCVRIDCDNAFLLGETLGCWREGPATFAAVKLLESLSGLVELTSRGECRDCSQDLFRPESLSIKQV
jgi:hypothetical protein